MITYAKARAEDVAPALELALKVYCEFEAPQFGPQAVEVFKNGFVHNQKLIECYKSGKFEMFCAFDGQKIVGMIAERGRGHICMVFVDGSYHRRGIATALMDRMTAALKAKGFRRITLNAAPYGLPFYLCYGFRKTGETRCDDGITYTPLCFGERFEYVLFDLDGTITDPFEGITNSVAYSLEKFGIHTADMNELRRFIGPPLRVSYAEYYDFDRDQAEQAVAYYREYYMARGIFECKIYNGAKQLLKKLKDECKVIILATSKPTVSALRVLEHFGIAEYFDYVSGAELDGRRDNKSEVIEYAISQCNITRLSQTLMIGDRDLDIIGAQQAEIKSAGVIWGYGGAEELHKAGADYIVDSFADLEKLVLS